MIGTNVKICVKLLSCPENNSLNKISVCKLSQYNNLSYSDVNSSITGTSDGEILKVTQIQQRKQIYFPLNHCGYIVNFLSHIKWEKAWSNSESPILILFTKLLKDPVNSKCTFWIKLWNRHRISTLTHSSHWFETRRLSVHCLIFIQIWYTSIQSFYKS